MSEAENIFEEIKKLTPGDQLRLAADLVDTGDAQKCEIANNLIKQVSGALNMLWLNQYAKDRERRGEK